jgi:hypothetical protein
LGYEAYERLPHRFVSHYTIPQFDKAVCSAPAAMEKLSYVLHQHQFFVELPDEDRKQFLQEAAKSPSERRRIAEKGSVLNKKCS